MIKLDLKKVLTTFIHFIPQTAIISMLFIMSYLFLVDNRDNVKARIMTFLKNKWMAAVVLYSACLLTVTLIGRYRTNPYRNMIGSFGVYVDGKINEEVLINLILYVPYAYLFIKANKPKHAIRAGMLLTIGTTACIEVLQLLFWLGQFSIADIIHNTIGGMIGCGLWYIENIIKKSKSDSEEEGKKGD